MYRSPYEPQHSQHSSAAPTSVQIAQLWMGELDQRWDELTVRQIFNTLLAPHGITPHSIKLIRDKQSSQLGLSNAGYCFIRFYNFEDASKVLALFNGKPIPGTDAQKFFRLNWSSANLQAAHGSARSLPETSEYSVFVGDLAQGVTEQHLLETFQTRYPSCTNAKVMFDQNTGHNRGYGFVKFLNDDEYHRVLEEMQGFVLMGRPIRVSPATKSSRSGTPPVADAIPHSAAPTLVPGPDHTGSAGSHGVVPPLPHPAPAQYYADPSNTTIFIGGLNIPYSELQLRDLFSRYGELSYVKIPTGKNCGFVQFCERAPAELALSELQGLDIGGCRIRLSWGQRAAQRIFFARQLTKPAPGNSNANTIASTTAGTTTNTAAAAVAAGAAAATSAISNDSDINDNIPETKPGGGHNTAATTEEQYRLNDVLLSTRKDQLNSFAQYPPHSGGGSQ